MKMTEIKPDLYPEKRQLANNFRLRIVLNILHYFQFESTGISHSWPTMQNALKSQQLRVLEPSSVDKDTVPRYST